MPAPDEMPKRVAKTMVGIFVEVEVEVEVGNHMAMMRTVVKKHMRIMMLKWPCLSARALGTVRPIMLGWRV